MKKTILLSQEQILGICVMSSFGSATYNLLYATEVAGRGGWLLFIANWFIIMPFVLWIFKLHKKQDTIFKIIETGLNKFISKILSAVTLIIIAVLSSIQLNQFSLIEKIFFLQKTPSWIIMLFIVIMCVIFLGSGIENLGRLAFCIFLISLFLYYTVISSSFINTFNLDNVIPVFDFTFKQFTKGFFFSIGSVCEFLLLLMVLIEVIPNSKKHYSRVFYGMFITSFIIFTSIIIYVGVYGVEKVVGIVGGGINVVKTIEIGGFISGVEIFITTAYHCVIIIQVAIYLYCISKLGQYIFCKSKIFLILAAVLILAVSIIMNSYNAAYFLSVFVDTYITLPFVFLILLISSLSIMLTKRRNLK